MSSTTEMHMDVVLEAQRHVVTHGLEAEVEYHPDEEYLPYIISYRSQTPAGKHGTILVFPQEDLYFTSSQLSFIIKQIRQTEEDGGQTLMVFHQDSINRVKNILDTTGVTNHAELAVFNKERHHYRMQWSLS